jgi:hypothetical protein
MNQIIENIINVDVLVNNRSVKQYHHHLETFIEAKIPSEYSIKIKNRTGQRKLAVVTVDGINVIDGQSGGSSNAGYILPPWESITVNGFRTSNSEVHPFVFSTKENSYAAKSEETQGDTRSVGVIGVRILSERTKPQIKFSNSIRSVKGAGNTVWYESDYNPMRMVGTSASDPCLNNPVVTCSCSSNVIQNANLILPDISDITDVKDGDSNEQSSPFNVGTEFSQRAIEDNVCDVPFDIGVCLGEIQIFYTSREGLLKLGINVNKEKPISFPDPFPKKFCKPPSY